MTEQQGTSAATPFHTAGPTGRDQRMPDHTWAEREAIVVAAADEVPGSSGAVALGGCLLAPVDWTAPQTDAAVVCPAVAAATLPPPLRSRPLRTAATAVAARVQNRPRSPRTSSPPPRASGHAKRRGSGSAERDVLGGGTQQPEEREHLQAVLAGCAEALTAQHLRELKSLQEPPGAVGSVLEVTAILLGTDDTRWHNVRKVLQKNLPERIRSFNFERVTLGQFRRVQKLLLRPGFDEESIGRVCPAALPLATWCRTVGTHLAESGFRGSLEVDVFVSDMVDQLQGCNAGSMEHPLLQELQEPQPQPEPMEAEQSTFIDRLPVEHGGLAITPDLALLSAEERRRVTELQVERPGVSSIVFHGSTDCTGLDIPRLVRLAPGEVLVYPEPGSKPPPGQGLNKHATVTMHGCWPPNARGRLQDVRSQERYREKIRRMTEERGATFLDYNCSTGVWRFQVEHF